MHRCVCLDLCNTQFPMPLLIGANGRTHHMLHVYDPIRGLTMRLLVSQDAESAARFKEMCVSVRPSRMVPRVFQMLASDPSRMVPRAFQMLAFDPFVDTIGGHVIYSWCTEFVS